MEIRRIRLAYNNVYAVESAGVRVLVDTGPDYAGARATLAEALNGWRPDVVVATHAHVDHAGLGLWWQQQGVPVALTAADRTLASHPHYVDQDELDVMVAWVEASGAPEAIRIEAVEGLERRREWALLAANSSQYPPAGSQPRWPTGLRYESFAASRTVADGDEVAPGVRVLECPGHTPGHVVFHTAEISRCFVGDVLFAGSIGRTDFPGGDHDTLIASITGRLWPLGDATVFIPGHGPESSFGRERRTNPYVGGT